jgi:hypothetical protein
MENELKDMTEEYGCANPQLSYLIVLAGTALVSFSLGFLVAWLIFRGC